MNLSQTLRSLSHRNFRLFFIGQSVSLIGTWMQQLAMQWVIYELTRKTGEADAAYWLGMVGFASQIPALFVAPFAGVFVDHWNRHRLIILTQTLFMLQAFVLAGLTLTDTINVSWIMVLSVIMGLINAFDMPGRQAFLTEMIDSKEDLSNAIALNSSMFNGARLVGPMLAAMLLAIVGAGVCFLANGVSYLAVLAALLAMRVPPRQLATKRPPLYRGLSEGVGYAFGFAPIRNILFLVALMCLAGMSYNVLLPLIATQVLHLDNIRIGNLVLDGDKIMFGLLTTAGGIGALCGAVYLAARKSVLGLGRWILFAPGLAGLALVLLSFSTTPWLSLPFLMVVGFSIMVHMGSSNIVVQTVVDEDKRGRVMSFYTMAFMGMTPLGSLLFGSVLARYFGPTNAICVGGLACMVGSLAFALQYQRLRKLIRPIYIRMGILPEMASGVYPAVASPSPLPEQTITKEPAA